MAKKQIPRASDELEDKVIDAVLNGEKYEDLPQILGLKLADFGRYLKQFVDFKEDFKEALAIDALRLEGKLKTMHVDIHNEKKAQLYSKNLLELLKIRDRKRYGDKQEIQLGGSVDLTAAITDARDRLVDVTPKSVQISPTQTPVIELIPRGSQLTEEKNRGDQDF